MKKNIGKTDKMIRLMIALVIAVLYYTSIISGTISLVLAVIAIIFAMTSLINFCPLYAPFGISTRKTKNK